MTSDTRWENMLDQLTDALLTGKDVDSILMQEEEKAAPFVTLIEGLQNSLFQR